MFRLALSVSRIHPIGYVNGSNTTPTLIASFARRYQRNDLLQNASVTEYGGRTVYIDPDVTIRNRIWQKKCEFIRKMLIDKQKDSKNFKKITVFKYRFLKIGNDDAIPYTDLLDSLNIDEC